MDRPTRRYLPAILFGLLVLVVSLVPAPGAGGPTPALLGVALDKWVHAGSYGVLTLLLARSRRSRTVAGVALVAAIAVAYGGTVELLQTLVPSRSTSVADLLANAVGASLAGLAWTAVRVRRPTRRSEQ